MTIKLEQQGVTEISSDFEVRKTRLPNNLVVITERVPHVRSVSFGAFLRTGSRHETPARNGIMHFIEHALFKGTRHRSAAEIAAESAALGGHLDAFTGREMVGFQTKVLDLHLARAFELLADLVTAPAFESSEIEKERNVILEEIKMVEDTPDDLVFEIFSEHFYPRHPLGRSILGTPLTLARFKRRQVQQYYDRVYRGENLVIAAAGNIDHGAILELARKHFGSLPPRGERREESAPKPVPHLTLRHKADLEQSHLVIGAPCPSLLSADRYVAHLLTLILGGGMSSRLFQSVREDRGLAYTVFSSISPFRDAGYLSIYAGASTEQLRPTIEATVEELRRIKTEEVSAEELQRNKDQLKASLILNLESSSSRMGSLAQQEMAFGRFISTNQVMRGIDRVSAQDVRRLSGQIFRPEALALTVLGNLKGFKIDRAALRC